jgi:hypothetical protein
MFIFQKSRVMDKGNHKHILGVDTCECFHKSDGK